MSTVTHYNNKPIVSNWIKVEGKPKNFSNIKVIIHENMKLAEFHNVCVQLCNREGCLNLVKANNVCKSHLKNKEVYRYCRFHGGCTIRATQGYEIGKPLYCLTHKTENSINVITNSKCHHTGCKIKGTFGIKGTLEKFCKAHKQENMTSLCSKICQHQDCKIIGSFGIKGASQRFCKAHKTEEMKYLHNKTCRHDNCPIRATYGNPGESPTRCVSHKTADMISLVHKRCQHSGCKISARYGIKGLPDRFCNKHKSEKMICLEGKLCKYKGCEKRAIYSHKGEKAQFCKEHKSPLMINVTHPVCQEPNCLIRAIFANEGEPPKFCKAHKNDNMKSVYTKLCEHSDCKKQPSYGEKDKTARFCSDHKLDNMVNLYAKFCSFQGCQKIGSFGFNLKSDVFCAEHRTDEMINLKNKKCEITECRSIAAYGLKGNESTHCKKHKTFQMIRFRGHHCKFPRCNGYPTYCKLYSKKYVHCREHSTLNEYNKLNKFPICTVIGCNNSAKFYDIQNTNLYPIRCNDHKLTTDIQLIERECLNCKETLYFPENRDICMECGKYRPKILQHFKEYTIKEFFRSNNINFSHDTRISASGSIYRPDFVINAIFGKIIVEVDERQHLKYNKDKELHRMKTIYHDAQLENPKDEVLFLRYNPDDYNSGKCDLQTRMKYLYTMIISLKEIKTINTPLAVVYLFYNDFDDNNVQIKPLSIEKTLETSNVQEEIKDLHIDSDEDDKIENNLPNEDIHYESDEECYTDEDFLDEEDDIEQNNIEDDEFEEDFTDEDE